MAPRYITPGDTGHECQQAQASMIRQHIIVRDNHAQTNGSAASSTAQT
jgi:hypothetical protein